jgi:hypothetical protein
MQGKNNEESAAEDDRKLPQQKSVHSNEPFETFALENASFQRSFHRLRGA